MNKISQKELGKVLIYHAFSYTLNMGVSHNIICENIATHKKQYALQERKGILIFKGRKSKKQYCAVFEVIPKISNQTTGGKEV